MALTLVGVVSGASDVAINTVAGRAERATGRPVITRVHAVFSTFVVVASLSIALLTGIGAPAVTPFALVAVGALLAAALMSRTLSAHQATRRTVAGIRPDANRPTAASATHATQLRTRTLPAASLIGLGLLGALAFASENAHQSWSSIVITDTLGTEVAVGSLAPAVFAAAVAITRFAAGGHGSSTSSACRPCSDTHPAPRTAISSALSRR